MVHEESYSTCIYTILLLIKHIMPLFSCAAATKIDVTIPIYTSSAMSGCIQQYTDLAVDQKLHASAENRSKKKKKKKNKESAAYAIFCDNVQWRIPV